LFCFGKRPVFFLTSNTSLVFLQIDDVLGMYMPVFCCCGVTTARTESLACTFPLAASKNIFDISIMHLQKVIRWLAAFQKCSRVSYFDKSLFA
jgi:hypothetical protein